MIGRSGKHTRPAARSLQVRPERDQYRDPSGQIAVSRAVERRWEFIRDYYYQDPEMTHEEVRQKFWREFVTALPLQWLTPESDDLAEH